MRILELFSGLGGWRYALSGLGNVVAAYDISPAAVTTYALNHGERPIARELASVPVAQIAAHGANTWVLSPPCQPFCRMGNQKGLEDRRSQAFLNLMDIFPEAPPDHLVLENVIGFVGSDAHRLLLERLERHGLHHREYQLCPTQFGIPNQRPRFFLVASKRALPRSMPPCLPPDPISGYLDAEAEESLFVEPEVLAKHKAGLDLVTAQECRTACFIGGYGQRYVGSGSFLQSDRGIRRFSVNEVARLLGLPSTFRFPEDVGREQRYKLLGNGLSIPVARWVMERLVH